MQGEWLKCLRNLLERLAFQMTDRGDLIKVYFEETQNAGFELLNLLIYAQPGKELTAVAVEP